MDLLLEFINRYKKQHLFTKDDRLLLAVSGGVDSVVLAHLCHSAGFEFGMAHCNFQLRGEDSMRDEKFVEALSKKYNVPFYTIRFNTLQYASDKSISTQVAARELRYNWFAATLVKENFKYLLTAHHADDNVETVFMNFLRGTGVHGLTGIKAKAGCIIRPLLFAKRSRLQAYLTENDLAFVQDESNLHDDYSRNYFRNTALPLLSKTFPEVLSNINHNIERFSEVAALYDQAIAVHKSKLLKADGDVYKIAVLQLQKTHPAKTILYELIKPFGFSASQLSEVFSLLGSESGRFINSVTHRILKDRKHLIITPLKNSVRAAVVINGLGNYVFDEGLLHVSQKTAEGFKIDASVQIGAVDAKAVGFPLLLRPWKTGDYFYPLGMQKKKKLSRFFIDLKLPLSEKEKIWVVEMNKKIIWVVGLRIDDRFKITKNTQEVLVLTFSKG